MGRFHQTTRDTSSKSQLKKSTNEFYSYVTVYAITQNRQLTLAVYPVTRGTSKVAYIAHGLDAITTTGLRIQALCLDREFSTRKVIDFLTTVQIPFILPVRKHRRAMKQLLNGTKSGLESISCAENRRST